MNAAKQLGLTDRVQAQTDTVDAESTVQGQLENLPRFAFLTLYHHDQKS